ncbi:pirin family protein [Ulvibacter litoralis]|uniref:Pirin family protein n=1 Tax=Ulvibacter litoralis TaxID=227084 RepID=A0A1G7I4Z7_9FLAO|nr:pirin family protein [Ulvibacter litoralis]GHC62550.1 hypothetical protein GCM10008083_29640 [Ulvibacter litoralis]SDF07504.1 hypothetical protein SAMN05421855_10587 [Ulvibacter litoralis]
MKTNSSKEIGRSDFVSMGGVRLRQPFPTEAIEAIDPFLLLHHYGPYEINEYNNPMDLGPHPHRGFEPITFLISGEQLHRDSLGNESVVKGGDVQWTTAGRGVIHAEAPTKEFVKKGGTLEGIQLWLNLPSEKKMIPSNYQHVESDHFLTVTSEDGKVILKVIAGELEGTYGRFATQTAVNAYMISVEAGGKYELRIPESHQSLLYLLDGEVKINASEVLKKNENQLLWFHQDGEGITFEGNAKSTLLFLSGEPIKEKVTSWGPYVMNTQTEIMEALRDYQQGKMGFLPA